MNREKTLGLLSQRIEQDPKNVVAWWSRGLLLRHQRDYEGAARDLKEALRLDPNHVYAILSQESIYRELGQYSEAIATYNKAIALAPGNAHGYHHRGKCYLEQERPAEAIADFTKAVELNPNWPQPYFSRAQARSGENVGDYDGALSDYDAFFRLEQKCFELVALRARITRSSYT